MNYAVVGMASIVGGVTGAAMTAIVMVFEMTRDYVIIIPLIIAVAISIGVRRGLLNETIYTIKLARQGKHFSSERHRNMFLLRHAEDFMEESFVHLPPDTLVDDAFARIGRDSDVHYILLTNGVGIVTAVLAFSELLNAEHEGNAQSMRLDELGAQDFVFVHANNILSEAVKQLTNAGVHYAVVIPDYREEGTPSEVLGFWIRIIWPIV